METIEIVFAVLGVGATIVIGVFAVRYARRSAREAKRQSEIALINAGLKRATPAITGVRKEPTLPPEPEPEIDPLLAKPDREIRGRDADIERIDAAFKDRGGLPAVAVTGPGGYGKTALAGEYARRRARRYRGVWLVDATSLGETRNSLARLGARLGIEVPEKAEEGIDFVLNALKAEGGRWLLIHDNIDDPARLGELQHQLQHPDCIDHLMTSREANWTGKAKTVALDVLPGDEAVALLAAESERDGEAGLAEMAAQVLDRHPLALVVAGQTLRHNREVTVAELSERFHERLKVAPESETYNKSLYVAVEESLDRLDDDAKALLKLAAFLSPDDIAPEFLVEGAEAIAATGRESLPEPLASLATDGMRRGDAFAACRG
ncbi:MAG: NB-ARC domain-containing protein, partial [Limibaculum sp.]